MLTLEEIHEKFQKKDEVDRFVRKILSIVTDTDDEGALKLLEHFVQRVQLYSLEQENEDSLPPMPTIKREIESALSSIHKLKIFATKSMNDDAFGRFISVLCLEKHKDDLKKLPVEWDKVNRYEVFNKIVMQDLLSSLDYVKTALDSFGVDSSATIGRRQNWAKDELVRWLDDLLLEADEKIDRSYSGKFYQLLSLLFEICEEHVSSDMIENLIKKHLRGKK
ncbi:MAG: hypothetical protein CMF60_04665 [Magnetococcales bacterium]|nr:hypothetical protein [Magnetococcales bacterium]|tara:strand:+ start:22480 stop:23145 length:666 start_codon:yes stop_codon:yes gene_type:complete